MDVSGSSTTVVNRDKIAVKVTSHSSPNIRAQVKVTIGTSGAWFTVTTTGPPPPPPRLVVTLALSASSISENGGVSTVTATLSRTSSAATTVTVTAATGLYTVGSDATIVIAAGETANATDTVTITAVDDDKHWGSDVRSITVRATAANNGETRDVSVNWARLTLTDDETLPTVTLALSPTLIPEWRGVSTVTATLSGASTAAVTVTVSAAAGTGAVAADFTLSGQTELTIAAGRTTSSGRVTITARPDNRDGPDKLVTVSGTVSGGYGVSAPSSVTLTLADATPDLFFFPDRTGVAPSAVVTSNEITVAGLGASVTASFDFCRFETRGVRTPSAGCTLVKNGADVSGSRTTVANGDKIAIKVTSHGSHLGKALVKVAIGTHSTWFTVTTHDAKDTTADFYSFTPQFDAAPGAVVTSNEVTVAGLGTSVTARFYLCVFEAPVTLARTTTGAACTLVKNGADVSGSSTTVVNGDKIAVKVTANSVNSGFAMVKVGIGTQRYTPWFAVTTRPPAPPGPLVIRPLDTRPDPFNFTGQSDVAPGAVVASNEITVAGLGTSVTARVGICRFESPVLTDTGAACTLVKNGVDVSGPGTTVVNGDKIAVKVKSNSAGSGSALAAVWIGSGRFSYSLFWVWTLPTVTLALSSTRIPENGGVSTVTATLSGVSSEAVTVTVGAAPVAPAASGDYALSSATELTIAAGNTSNWGRVTIAAVDNSVDEPDKEVRVSGTASGGNDVADPAGHLTLTIEDDEGAPTVRLALSPSSISESGGVSTVTATLSRASSEAVTVTVGAAAGTGAVAADFLLSSAKTLTIAAGSTTSTGTVTVTAVGNTTDTPDKSVTVSATVAGGGGAANPSDATLTLTDDDAAPGVTLALSPTSVSENGGVSTVTATLSHPSSAATTVTVTAVDGAYTVGSDATIVIAAGETANATDSVTITAVNDDAHQGSGGRSITVRATARQRAGRGARDRGAADADRRRDAADGSAGPVVVVDFGERRGLDGYGDAFVGVERGGDGDGGHDAGRGRGRGGLRAVERDGADDHGGFDDEHGRGDGDGER